MRSVVAMAVLAAALCGAAAARAQEAPPATAPAATTPAATTPPETTPAASAPATSASPPVAQPGGDTTADQIAAWMRAGQPQAAGDAPDQGDGLPRRIHGEVGVTVSNRGYGGYAAASVPIGDNSDVDVAVAGAHERLPWGGGSVNSRSLAIGVHLDGADVGRWLRGDHGGDKCIQHAVRLRDDPVLMADGTCARPTADSPPDPGS